MARVRGIFKVEDPNVFDPYTAVPDEDPLREVLILSENALDPRGVCSWVYLGEPCLPLEEELSTRFGKRLTGLSEIPPQVITAVVRRMGEGKKAVRIALAPGEPDTVVAEDPMRGLVAAKPVMAEGRFLGWTVLVLRNGRWLIAGSGSGLPKGPLRNLTLEVERELEAGWETPAEEETLGCALER